MVKLLKLAAAATLSASLIGGVAAAQGGSSIDTTGADSTNKVITKNINKTDIKNKAVVKVTSTNYQDADSGDVHANKNTTLGSVSSGNASNSRSLGLSASVDQNSGGSGSWMSDASDPASGGTISTTGFNSTNLIVNKNINKVNVDNKAIVKVTDNNTQNADSGDVHVNKNTTVGNVTSGSASNSSTSSFTLDVTQ